MICRFWQGFDSEFVLCSTILMYIVLNFCLNRILYEPNSYVLHIQFRGGNYGISEFPSIFVSKHKAKRKCTSE